MRLFSILACAGLFFAASAATADTTAVYRAKTKSFVLTMTVEVADNGDIRYQMSSGRTYGLVLGTTDYFVELGGNGPVVDRVEDLVTAQKEAMAAFLPAFKQDEATTGPELVPMGSVTINGRTGKAFGYKSEKGAAATTGVVFNGPERMQIGKVTMEEKSEAETERAIAATVVVISHDPDLAQLGKAMAKQLSTSRAMLTRMIGGTPGVFMQMEKVLQSGTPLLFATMELESVSHAPIDPKRFELPAQPETLDQIRERMKPLPPPPTATLPKP